MFDYHELEKEVFNFLYNKHLKDSSFTFSVRQNATQGAKANVFIGTEKGKYFGFTFWTIHVGYPGGSMDLIDVFFKFKRNGRISYCFEFNQTRNPQGDQNKAGLEFIQKIKPLIKNNIELQFESSLSSTMENYKTRPLKDEYDNFDDLINDYEKDFENIVPIINDELENFRKTHNEFDAHMINAKEFKSLLQGLQRRLGSNSEKFEFVEGKGIIEKTSENPEKQTIGYSKVIRMYSMW